MYGELQESDKIIPYIVIQPPTIILPYIVLQPPTIILPIAQLCKSAIYVYKPVEIIIDTVAFLKNCTLSNAIQIFKDANHMYTITHGANFASITGSSIVALYAGFQGSNIYETTFNVIQSLVTPIMYMSIAHHNNNRQPQLPPKIIATIASCEIIDTIIGGATKTYKFIKGHFFDEELTLSGETEYSDHIHN